MPHPPTDIAPILPPPLRTLLAWAWAGVDRTADKLPPALPNPTELSRLAELAAYHGLEPLLDQAVTRHASLAETVPPALRARWQQAARVNAAHALLCGGELAALLDLLAAHRIPAMPYKGVVLGAQIYGDAAARANGDIDIIVPRAQAAAAVDALRTARGYAPVYAFHTPRQEAQYVRNIHHYGLRQPAQGFVVELHWDVAGPAAGFKPDWPGIWARSKRSTWQGAPMHTPSDEDLLLLLALHGSKHQWSRLKWLVDVAVLVAGMREPDWAMLATRARQWRMTQCLTLTRTLLTALLDMDTGLDTPSPLLPSVLARIESMQDPGVAANLRALMHLHDRRRDRVRYAAHLFFSLNFQDLDGPTPGAFAAYLRRPRRILGNHGPALLGQLTREVLRGTRGP